MAATVYLPKRLIKLLVVIASLSVLSACGYKGPLTLPTDQAAAHHHMPTTA